MGDIVYASIITKLPIPVERVLQAAMEKGLTEVIIIGYDAEGQEYFASSEPSGPEALWSLERAKFKLLEIAGE